MAEKKKDTGNKMMGISSELKLIKLYAHALVSTHIKWKHKWISSSAYARSGISMFVSQYSVKVTKRIKGSCETIREYRGD